MQALNFRLSSVIKLLASLDLNLITTKLPNKLFVASEKHIYVKGFVFRSEKKHSKRRWIMLLKTDANLMAVLKAITYVELN